MRIESFDNDWRDYLTIFDPEKAPSKQINNVQILVSATTGFGKTLAEEKIIEEFHKNGYTILIITEKPGAPFEMGFTAFKPKAKYHLELLKQQGITPSNKKIKLYHPITINPALRNEMPPIKFFSIPVKTLTVQELTILLEVESRNYAITTLHNNIKKLNKEQGLLDLIWMSDKSIRKQTQKISKGKSIPKFDDQFFIPVSAAGSTKNISHIISNFEPFMTHYMLSNQESPHQLNWKEIMRDQEHYHIFSTGFIPDSDDKIKYFTVNWLLNQINENQHLKKNPLLIVVQEAKVFLPNTSRETYIIKTADNFMKKLSTMRSSGISSIADTQDYYGMAEGYRNSVNTTLIGQLNLTDLERMAKAMRMPPSQKERITKLPRNTYFMLGKEKEIAMLFPSHAHKEEGENFFKIWKQNNYPMKDYKELLNEITNLKQEEMNKAKERQQKIIEKIKEQEKEKEIIEKEKQTDKKDKETIKQLNEQKAELKIDKMILLYKESKLNPEKEKPKSWSKLGKEYGISDKTAKNWAEEGKKATEKETTNNNEKETEELEENIEINNEEEKTNNYEDDEDWDPEEEYDKHRKNGPGY